MPNEPLNRNMIDKWADCQPDREAITNFWDWLSENHGECSLFDIHLEKELDEYQGIDKRQLDQERSAILLRLSHALHPR